MKSRQLALRRRGLRLGIAGVAAVFAVTAAVKAEDCIDVQSTSDAPDFTTCETVNPEIDFNSAILEQSTSEAASAQSDALPWIASNPQDLPAQFSTTDTGVSVRTSLGTLRDYNVRSASPTIQQPEFTSAPTNFVLPPAPVARKTPIDVWTNIDVEGYDGARDQSTRAGVGADYKFNKTTTFGVSVEHGDARSAATSGVEQDQKASAYVTLQATPLLSLDARTEWQAGNSEFAASSGASERGAVVLAPKINHSFKTDDGATFSPFLTYEREFDISTSHKDGVDPGFDPAQSAGAGVTYTKPDAYSLSVSADVDNFGAAEDSQSLSSKFQLSVPFSK